MDPAFQSNTRKGCPEAEVNGQRGTYALSLILPITASFKTELVSSIMFAEFVKLTVDEQKNEVPRVKTAVRQRVRVLPQPTPMADSYLT